MTVRVISEQGGILKELNKISDKAKGKFAGKLVDDGYQLTQRIAPKAKDRLGGGTRQAVRTVKYKNNAKLELVQPKKRPAGNQGYRPYHMWMHGYGKYKIAPYIYTGDPKFMDTTFDYMVDKARKEFLK